jgi:lysophospholipase L1-like esterase
VKKITKQIKWLSIAGVGLLISAEIYARFVLGLGNPVLYETSSVYGYRAIPNQNVRRFGNRIFYNAQGLRSEPISPNPVPGTVRVLCIGDSITFGGAQTDQAKTYPYQLQELLNREGSKTFEVLNASAGGWAIENEEAYLRQKGIYRSKIVVLELGSHDLFQPKASGEIVGKSVNFPKKNPLFALEEGFYRYFIPRFLPDLQVGEANLQSAPTEKDLNRNMATFVRIANLVKARKAQLIVILVEQPDELEPKSALANFSKKVIANQARDLNIPYKNLQEDFRLAGNNKLFRDGLHPNAAGNKVMAEAVAKLIQTNFKTSKNVKFYIYNYY